MRADEVGRPDKVRRCSIRAKICLSRSVSVTPLRDPRDMTDTERIKRLESICRAQQRIIDSTLQHLNTMAAQAKSQGLTLSTMTMMLDGTEQSAVDAARRL